MKKITILTIILPLLLLISLNTNAQYFDGHSDSIYYWQVVYTPVTYSFGDIFFVDSLFGWIAHGNGGVLRTTNSGFNWDTTQLINGGPVNGVHFINRDTGWAVGIASLIRKTTNGGINWINQDWPNSAYYRSVHFFDYNTGIVTGNLSIYIGNYAYIIRTSDGGNNWNQTYLSDSQSTDLYKQFWLNNYTGWVCGLDILLRTTNGGISFISYYSKIPASSNGHNGFLNIFFIDENTGWVCGNNIDHKNIYKTTNGGDNWIFQTNPISSYGLSQVNGIIFANANTGWASSYVGYVITTTNGGINWIINQNLNDENWNFTKYLNTKIWLTGVGKIWYILPQLPIGVKSIENSFPSKFSLSQNYPNPFNPTTKIKFDIAVLPLVKGELEGVNQVHLKVFDILGREVVTLVNEQLKPGTYEVEFDGSKLSSGVYFYKLIAGNFTETRKMVIIK